jgi:hypothetical protein
MPITTTKQQTPRVYVTATDPVTKRSKSQVFYNTTPEDFIGEAVEKLCRDEPRRPRRKVPA